MSIKKIRKKNKVKKILIYLLSFLISIYPVIPLQNISSKNELSKQKIYIFDIEDRTDSLFKDISSKITNSLIISFTQSGYFDIVSKDEAIKVTGSAPVFDTTSLEKLKNQLNVELAITGRVEKLEIDRIRKAVSVSAVVKLIDVSTGELLGKSEVKGSSGERPGYTGAYDLLVYEALNNVATAVSLELIKNYVQGGIVLLVSGGKVRVNLGKVNNINPGAELGVKKEKEIIGKLKVVKVNQRDSECEIISQIPGKTINSGDKIFVISNPIPTVTAAVPKKKIKTSTYLIGAGILALGVLIASESKKKEGPPPPTGVTNLRTTLLRIDANHDGKVEEYEIGIKVEWDPSPDPSVLGYKVYRSEDGGKTFTLIATIEDRNQTYYVDGYEELTSKRKILDPEKTYIYMVTTYNRSGESKKEIKTPPVQPDPKKVPTVPSPPTDLKGSAGDKKVSLSWVKPTTNEDNSPLTNLQSFKIYRATSEQESPSVIDAVSASVTTYTDTNNLENGKTYYYRVTAVNDKGVESKYSNVCAVTPTSTPPNVTITVNADPPSIKADGISTSTIKATVKDSITGAPVVDGTEVVFTTTAGKLSSYSVTTTGGVAQVVLTSSVSGAQISANITAKVGNNSGTTTVTFVPPTISEITLTANPTLIKANPQESPSSSEIIATVKDEKNNPVPDGLVVTFTTTLGIIDSSSLTEGGIAKATLKSDGKAGVATITARVGGISATTQVSIAGGASVILLTASPSSIPADGKSTSTITALVKDENNNAIPNLKVTFSSTSGTIVGSPATTDSEGKAIVKFYSTTPETVTIRATSEGITGETTISVTNLKIVLTATPSSIPADGTSKSTIKAQVTDLNNNPVSDGTLVNFSTTRGTITPSATTSSGIATAILTSEKSSLQLEATVTASSGGATSQTLVIFVVNYPASITLTANPSAVPADSSSYSTIFANVKDKNNNPVNDGTTVEFLTDLGTIYEVTQTVNGQATCKIKSSTAGIANITAQAQGETSPVTATTSVVFTGLKISMNANPTSIRANGTDTSTISARVVYASTGSVVQNGTTVKFVTNMGKFTQSNREVATATTSSGIATVTLTGCTYAGTAVITASVPPELNPSPYPSDAYAQGKVQVSVTAFGPSTISLTASPDVIPADGISVSTLTAELKDQYGSAVADGTYVYFISSDPNSQLSPSFNLTDPLGNPVVAARSTTSGGIATATLKSSTNSQTVLITAIYDDPNDDAGNPNDPIYGVLGAAGTKLRASTQVTFSAGGVSKITLGLKETNIHGWDYLGNKTTVTAYVRDSNNSPVPDGTKVYWSISGGMIEGTTTTQYSETKNGSATATITTTGPFAPGPRGAGIATVTAISGGVAGTIDLIISSVPYGIQYLTAPDNIPSAGSATLSVFIYDINGNPVAPLYDTSHPEWPFTVEFSASGLSGVTFTPSSVNLGSTSVATTTITVPAVQQPVNMTVLIKVSCPKDGTYWTATRNIPVGGEIPPPANYQINLRVLEVDKVTPISPPEIIANNADKCVIEATVVDRDKNNEPVVDAKVDWTTTKGAITASSFTDINGVAYATLTSSTEVTTATVTATCMGNKNTVEIEFIPGPPSSLKISATPTKIGTGGKTAAIIAEIKDSNDHLVRDGTPVLFTSSGLDGTFDPATGEVETTAGKATISYISGTQNGTTTITATSTATVRGKQGTATGDIILTVVGDPAFITVYTNPSSITADGSSTLTVTATIRDNRNTPVLDNTSVTFTTTRGVFTESGSQNYSGFTKDGVATATLRSDITADNNVRITVTSGSASATATVKFLPGPPAEITLTVNPTEIIANGTSTSTITATVKDANGNLVANGINVTFTASSGTLNPPSGLTMNGTVTTILTSSTTKGISYITATSGGAVGVVSVRFKAGEPANIELQRFPDQVRAGGGKSRVTAIIRDRNNNLVDNDGNGGNPWQCKFTIEGEGTFEENGSQTYTTNVVDGSAVVNFVSGSNIGESKIKAETLPTPATASVIITVVPASAIVRVTANPSSIRPNGIDTSTITATVIDSATRTAFPDGTKVYFSADKPGVSIYPSYALTQNGEAKVTLKGNTEYPAPGVKITAIPAGVSISNPDNYTYVVISDRVPSVPTGVTATAGDGNVVLNWNPNPEGDQVTEYRIYRTPDWSTPGPKNPTPSTATTFTDNTDITNGTTYYYQVSAKNNKGEGNKSSAVSALPLSSKNPNTPTGLTATAHNRYVELTWNPKTSWNTGSNQQPDISEIRIYRSTTETIGYEKMVSFDISGTNDRTSFIDDGTIPNFPVNNGTTYYYKIASSNKAGLESPRSSPVSATPITNLPPGIPQNVQVIPGDGGITLSWDARPDTEKTPNWPNPGDPGLRYNIEIDSGTGFTPATGSPTTDNSLVITNLINGKKYALRINAENKNGKSAWRGDIFARPVSSSAPPKVVGVTATGGNRKISLTWTPINPNQYPDVAGYYIYRATQEAGPWSEESRIATFYGNGQNPAAGYVDTELANGTTYYYRVSAVGMNSDGGLDPNKKGQMSDVTSATPNSGLAPSVPGNFTATAGNTTVTLTWNPNDVLEGVIYYWLYKDTDLSGGGSHYPPTQYPDDWVKIPSTQTTYQFSGLTNGTLYYFWIVAQNTNTPPNDMSALSGYVAAKPDGKPSPPTNLTATGGDKRVTLSWSSVSGAVSYRIYSSDNPSEGSNWTVITVPGSLTSYDVTTYYNNNTPGLERRDGLGMKNNTTYYFYMESVSSTGLRSEKTPIVSAKTNLLPPEDPVWSDNTDYVESRGYIRCGHQSFGSNQINYLHWFSMVDAESYDIQRHSGDGNWTDVATGIVGTPIADCNAGSIEYRDEGLINGVTYYYRIRANNSAGSGPWSAVLTLTPAGGVPPAAPTNLTATAGDSWVSLIWNPNTEPDLAGYRIYRNQTGTDWYNTAVLAEISKDVSSYTDRNVGNGTTYYYRVRAFNLEGINSAFSDMVSATPVTTSVPKIPQNLTPIPGDGGIILSWEPRPDVEKTPDWPNQGDPGLQYNIEINDGTGFTPAPGSPTPNNSIVITGLTNGTRYAVRVNAENKNGPSPWSEVVFARPVSSSAPPKVEGVTATGGNNKISLTWTPIDPNQYPDVAGYYIYRATQEAGPWSEESRIATFYGNGQNPAAGYLDTGLTNGTTYYYRVSAVGMNSDGGLDPNKKGQMSDVTSGTPNSGLAPSVPGNFTATAGNTTVTLTWAPNDASEGVIYYWLYKDTDLSGGGSHYPPSEPDWVKIPSTQTTYQFSGLTNGTLYYFWIVAQNTNTPPNDMSALSGYVAAKPDGKPSPPTNLTATGGDKKVTLSWSSVSGAVSYRIYSSDNPSEGSNWTVITVPGSLTSYDVTTYYNNNTPGLEKRDGLGMKNNTTYYFYMESVSSTGLRSEKTPIVSARTNLLPPEDPVWSDDTDYVKSRGYIKCGHKSFGSNQINYLHWFSMVDAESYDIQRHSGDGNWTDVATGIVGTPIADCEAGSIEYRDEGLINGVTYYYRIRANNSAGSGPWSAILTLTPAGGVPPAAPANLAATAGDGLVSLDWDDNLEPDLVGYRIYRNQTGTDWENTLVLAEISKDVSSYTDRNLTNGTTYYYRVKAFNLEGINSAFSNMVSATPVTTSVPKIPENVGAIAGDGGITVNWDARPDSEKTPNWPNPGDPGLRYNIEINDGSGFTPVNGSPTTNTSIVITNLTNGTRYAIRVNAENSNGTSPWSGVVFARPVSSGPPPIVTNVNVSLNPSNPTQINISWDAISPTYPDVASYRIYREEVLLGSSPTGNFTQIAELYVNYGTSPPTHPTSYTDINELDGGSLVNGRKYYYKVSAVGMGITGGPDSEKEGQKSDTAPANGIVPYSNNTPLPPTNPNGTPNTPPEVSGLGNAIRISWGYPDPFERNERIGGFHIFRATIPYGSSANWTQRTTSPLPPTQYSYIDNVDSNTTTYYYKVRALRIGANGNPSTTVYADSVPSQGITAATSNRPEWCSDISIKGYRLDPSDPTNILLEIGWDGQESCAGNENIAGYIVYRDYGPNNGTQGIFEVITDAETGENRLELTDTKFVDRLPFDPANPNPTYSYFVRIFNNNYPYDCGQPTCDPAYPAGDFGKWDTGLSHPSNIVSFVPKAPADLILLTPLPNENRSNAVDITFSWTEVDGAQYYYLLIGTSVVNAGEPTCQVVDIIDSYLISNTQQTVSPANYPTSQTIYWQVIAFDANFHEITRSICGDSNRPDGYGTFQLYSP